MAYAEVVKNCFMSELMPIGEDIIDSFKSYDSLASYEYKRYYRIKHDENQFATERNHINGIENFWRLCKVRLVKFRGISFPSLKCEFRYNFRNKNMYLYLLRIIKKNPLKLS